MLLELFRRYWIITVIVVVSAAVRIFFATTIGIFQDEALYWWLSQDQGLGFCPQPPAISLFVRWGESIFGAGTLGLRAGSIFFGTAGIIIAAFLGKEFFDRRSALWTAGLYAVCPLIMVISSIATPDAPIIFLWLLYLWVTWRAFQTNRLKWWMASGVILALGLYTKYMMALAIPATMLSLFCSAYGRSLLRRPGPWVSTGTGLALFLFAFIPLEIKSEWSTVTYHLAARHVWDFDPARMGEYLLGHMVGISPVTWIGILISFWLYARTLGKNGPKQHVWILIFGLFPIVFFLAPSIFTERTMIREHWDLIGYAAGIIAFAGLISGKEDMKGTKWTRLGTPALVVSFLIIGALFMSSFWPGLAVAVGRQPPTIKTLGWKELANRVRQLEHRHFDTPHFILTNYFGSALCLGFERRNREGLYTISTGHTRRYGLADQLRKWRMDQEHFLLDRNGQIALYIHEFRHAHAPKEKHYPKRVYQYFKKIELLDEVKIVVGGRIVRRFGLYRASEMKSDLHPSDFRKG